MLRAEPTDNHRVAGAAAGRNGGRRAERRLRRSPRWAPMEPLSSSTDAFRGVHGRNSAFLRRPGTWIMVLIRRQRRQQWEVSKDFLVKKLKKNEK